MSALTQKDLENFLKELTKSKDIFGLYEKAGIYGARAHLFNALKGRIEYCLDYLSVDFSTLVQRTLEYQNKNPKKEFGAINSELYQDEMHPVVMAMYYAISEPFMLRKNVKQELLYLAFKLQEIKNIFIAGVGCGEIFENISRVPLIACPQEISVKGVDISKSAVNFCKERSSKYTFKTVSEVVDLDFYNFSDKYDLIELSEVVEHVREPQKLINKAADSSKLILATIPLMLNVPDHLHVFSIAKIKEMFKTAKLDMIYGTLRNSFYIKQFFYFALLKGRG